MQSTSSSSSSSPHPAKKNTLTNDLHRALYDLVTKIEKRDYKPALSNGRFFALLNIPENVDSDRLDSLVGASKALIKVISTVHKKLLNKSLENFVVKDRKILEKFIKQMNSADSQTLKIINNAISIILLRTRKEKYLSTTQTMTEFKRIEDEYWQKLRKLNNDQVNSVPELSDMIQFLLYFGASEDPTISMQERMILEPQELAADTAGHSYTACDREGTKFAIIKSSTQGMCAKHNPKTRIDLSGLINTDSLNEYGHIPGQDVLGEGMTYALARILGLTLVPPTCLLRVDHHFFGAPNLVIKEIRGESKLKLTEQQCQDFLVETLRVSTPCSSSSSGPVNVSSSSTDGVISPIMFKQKLEQYIIQITCTLIQIEVFNYCKLDISTNFMNRISEILMGSYSTEEFKRQIIHYILNQLNITLEGDFPPHHLETFSGLNNLLMENLEKIDGCINHSSDLVMNASIQKIEVLANLLAKLPDTANAIVNAGGMLDALKRGRDLAEALMTSLITPAEQHSHLCSVQKWVLNGKNLHALTKDQQEQISPLSYAVLGILDGATVQQDRNAGNIVTIETTLDELQERIHRQIEGLPTLIHTAFHQSQQSQSQLEDPPAFTRRIHNLGNAIVVNQVSQRENLSIKEKITLESDIYQMLHLLAHKQNSYRACFAIDNAISFINPLLPAFNRELQSNNAWVLKPASQLALTPHFLGRYLTSINVVKDLLPQLDAVVESFHQLATGKEIEGMQWTNAQKSLFVLSFRIVQIGVELDKTAFEIALMKDRLNIFDDQGALLVTTPLLTLFDHYFTKNGQLLPLGKVKFDPLDKAIGNAYIEMSHVIGTFEDGFAAWNQAPQLGMYKHLVAKLQHQGISS